jgi:O-antigen/teichoic acid export membrane protein
MTGKVKDCRRNLYASAILSVGTACILIPLVGMIGAVISMSVSGVLLSILNSLAVIKYYDINYISLTGLIDKIIILNEKIILKLKVKIRL